MDKKIQDSLGVPGEKVSEDRKRKMTANIIEEETKKQEVYEFLEEDDEFEEFEIQANPQADAEMKQAGASKPEKELWQQDWDDEEVGEDFAAKLRQQLAKSK